MRILSVIFFVGHVFIAWAQDEVNQLSATGERNGLWIERMNDGRVVRMMEYETYVLTRQISEAEAFFHERLLGPEEDTVINSTRLLWIEHYLNDTSGQLQYVHRVDHDSNEQSFLFGPYKSVALDTVQYSMISRVGDIRSFDLSITNKLEQELRLKLISPLQGVTIEELIVGYGKKGALKGTVQIDDGHNRIDVILKDDSMVVKFSISTFEYAVRSEDLVESATIGVPTQFHYYRTGNEALLSLLSIENDEVLARIPLTRERTKVDLTGIETGEYKVVKTNYSTGERATSYFEIQ